MSIIYSQSGGLNNAAIGKLETPIKMIIEHESDLLTKQGGVRDWLFNVEKSNRFGETIVNENEFDIFGAVKEGAGAPSDSVEETSRKFIEHVEFMKEFAITAKMMEDANYGVAADAKRRAENFTRAYYKTQHQLCTNALVGGTGTKITFGGATVDTSTADGLPLFSSSHKWGNTDTTKTRKGYGTQSNFFAKADLFKTASAAEDALNELANKLRNFKDENGEPLGYTANTIILPGNRPGLEGRIKKVCGSEGALGNGYNDINIQYGNWNIIVMPTWQASDDRLMIMSSEANKSLGGNMFFNRVPLTVRNWVDDHTGNYIWTGRCRFGVGFGSYKHILLAVDGSSVSGATTLT